MSLHSYAMFHFTIVLKKTIYLLGLLASTPSQRYDLYLNILSIYINQYEEAQVIFLITTYAYMLYIIHPTRLKWFIAAIVPLSYITYKKAFTTKKWCLCSVFYTLVEFLILLLEWTCIQRKIWDKCFVNYFESLLPLSMTLREAGDYYFADNC